MKTDGHRYRFFEIGERDGDRGRCPDVRLEYYARTPGHRKFREDVTSLKCPQVRAEEIPHGSLDAECLKMARVWGWVGFSEILLIYRDGFWGSVP